MKKLLVFGFMFFFLAGYCIFGAGQRSPASQSDITIRVLVPPDIHSFLPGEDENNNEIIRWLEKFSGYSLHYTILPQEASAERITLEFASGNPSDMINMGGNRTLAMQFALQGYLTELTDYVANNQLIQKTSVVDPAVYQMGIVNGRYYLLCTPTSGSQESDSLAGLKKFTEPANIVKGDMSLMHIQNMLETAKRAYPNKIILTGAGQATNNYVLRGFQWLYGAFGVSTPWRESGAGRVEYTPLTRDMRDCLTYIADLNARGYLDPEYGALNIERVREKMLNENVVFSAMPWYGWADITQWQNSDTTPQWELYGNAVGTNGRKGQDLGNQFERIIVVPRTSRIAEAVVDYVAYLCQPEAYDYILFGEKDIDYVDNPDGNRTRLTNRRVTTGTNYPMYYRIYEQTEQRNMRLLSAYPGNLWNQVYIRTYGLELKSILDPTISMPTIPEYLENITDVNTLCAQYFLRIATGALPISAFDEFLTRFNSIGGQNMINAVNAWYASK